jgi:hypothetical protein
MILRELFEAKAKSVGIIFGRFNPPHMGHMKAWEMASENSVWYVGTNKSTQGPKDPLPFDIKVKAMQAVYPEIKGHIVAETSWLTLASKVYEKHGNIVLNVYTDEDWVTKTIIQYNGKEGTHGYYEFGTIQQQATPRLSSATALRAAVMADDRDLFGQAAGVDPNTLVAGHPFFDVVKHYLMPHAEKAAAKVVKKKVKEPDQGMEEGVAETMPWKEAQKVLNHYGADYFGTSYDKLYFYKYRKQFSISLIRDEDGNGNHRVNLSDLNAMVRKLRGMRVPLSPFEEGVAEDWNKVNHHDKTNGLSQKAVNAYRRENPGSKLKTAVTTKPSKLKAGSKDAKRRKSFCARMSGNKGPMKKPNGKPTPKALALRRWNCESVEEMVDMIIENMDHSKDNKAVPELKSALIAQKTKLQKASDDEVYDIVDTIMTRIAKTHGISGQKLHDMWVDQYDQVPDTWIMK